MLLAVSCEPQEMSFLLQQDVRGSRLELIIPTRQKRKQGEVQIRIMKRACPGYQRNLDPVIFTFGVQAMRAISLFRKLQAPVVPLGALRRIS